jgi:hypothetical protein
MTLLFLIFVDVVVDVVVVSCCEYTMMSTFSCNSNSTCNLIGNDLVVVLTRVLLSIEFSCC